MCRRIIERWEPCNHMRLLNIIPCDTARGTPGQSYEECACGDNCFLDEPSKTPCPVCWKNEAFREHTEREARRLAGSHIQRPFFLEDSSDPDRRTATSSSSKPASHKTIQSPCRHRPSSRANTVHSASLTIVCGLGEHDFVDINGESLLCVKCGTIHGSAPPEDCDSNPEEPATPLQSFADDEEGDIASTPRGDRSVSSLTENLHQSVDEFDGHSVTSPAKHGSDQLSMIGDAPIPSTMTSNARAEESWKIYQNALGRRLPDF